MVIARSSELGQGSVAFKRTIFGTYRLVTARPMSLVALRVCGPSKMQTARQEDCSKTANMPQHWPRDQRETSLAVVFVSCPCSIFSGYGRDSAGCGRG